jgi:hypothetical protein
MSVKIVSANVPSKAYANQPFEAIVAVHAEQDVENMGIALCYSGGGNMYARPKGVDRESGVPRCGPEGVMLAFYHPGKQSRCTVGAVELRCWYTATGTASLKIAAGYLGKDAFYVTDERNMSIVFEEPPLIEKGDLVILVPAVAVPTIIGAATRRAALGAGIGALAAGSYIGYKAYRWYRA